MMLSIKLVSILFIIVVCYGHKFYEGYKVIELNLKTDSEVDIVHRISNYYGADIWKGPIKYQSTEIMLSPTQFEGITKELGAAGIIYSILYSDVDKLISDWKQSESVSYSSAFHGKYSPSKNPKFPSYVEIVEWMKKVSEKYNFVSMSTYGKSLMKRNLTVLKISTGANRKIVLIDAGIHAREWLSITTILYMADKLIRSYIQRNTNSINLLSKYDFYFIPVINPDGYNYSYYENRLLRTNLRTFQFRGEKCLGVDLNRNFDVNFARDSQFYPRCETYPGPKPFSEPETEAFANFTRKLGSRIVFYTALHTYSQLWLIPYNYDSSIVPEFDKEVRRVAYIGRNALHQENGMVYKIGKAAEFLGNVAGTASDWMKSALNVKYVYTLELRPDKSKDDKKIEKRSGFLARKKDIKPTGKEVYAGIMTSLRYITD